MALLKYTVDDQEKMFLYLIELDCKKHHDHKNGLCQEHQKLADYVSRKIKGCPYDRTRRICTIHDLYCFNMERRRQIEKIIEDNYWKAAMHHPILALRLRALHGRMAKM